MTSTVTENDLILFYYKELDQQRSAEIRNALLNDEHLSANYQELVQALQLLNKAFMNPSQTSVDIIREHSGHYSSLETS